MRQPLFVLLLAGLASSCSSTTVGTTCASAADCYVGIDAGALSGPVQCIDKATDGYCTHECATDADCCSVAGECASGFKQVCAPFESSGLRMCFLSCEDADIVAAPNGGTTDPNAYCSKFSAQNFGCRSTGGGSANRKVCFP